MDGLKIALERIAREADEQMGILDIGYLGLDGLPDELFELTHLRVLNLGYVYIYESRKEREVRWAKPELGPNRFDCHDPRFARLVRLIQLSLTGVATDELLFLDALKSLKILDFCWVAASDLSPLAGLVSLWSLRCSHRLVSDLSPLRGLRSLKDLFFPTTSVSDLSPLVDLKSLKHLVFFDTPVSELLPLARLPLLKTLNFSGAPVSDLSPLADLGSLEELNCSRTSVSDLSPLAHLKSLNELVFVNAPVSELLPLARLRSLKTLDFSGAPVSDLSPLAGLGSLGALNCSRTLVSDLSPLAGLGSLQTLDCSECHLTNVPDDFWWKPSLEIVFLHRTHVPGVPAEVLSQESYESCLESLRAHLRDLADGQEEVLDVKLMVLGNGRVGKTQICRRLRGEGFDESVVSTHGVQVTSAPIAVSDGAPPARLQIWDFGGQDIYHGTHALFMRSRAVFLVVWSPGFEDRDEYSDQGYVFRNQPLAYWLEYVRQLGGEDSPVVIVQTRCDSWKDEARRLPVSDEAVDAFRLPPSVVKFSARTDHGRAGLDEALQRAVAYLREERGTAVIGTGRAAVKRRIEALRDADAARPPEARLHRTLSQEAFQQFCDEAGGVTAPEHLLNYLNNAGTVFYREGLFGDRIVVDQAWALEAIYAVLHREKSLKHIARQRGRFTRSDLAEWIWDEAGYGPEEQKLFLDMMRSCGICFVHRPAVDKKGIEAEYIAPDLLPRKDDTEIDQKWDPDRASETAEFRYTLLLPSLMRSIISQIGGAAGLAADYWRGGVFAYEAGTRSRAVIEEVRDTNGWGGAIRIATQGGQATMLLRRLAALVERQQQQAGLRPSETTGVPPRLDQERPGVPPDLSAGHEAAPAVEQKFEQEPAVSPEYFVSYAWKDDTPEGRERDRVVDQLCETSETRGIQILRDKNEIRIGDRLSKFMQRLTEGNRVFVVLSDKYLRSPFCMYELAGVWRNCRQDDAELLKRIRVYTLPDAKIWTPMDRAQYAVHWRKESADLEALVKEHGFDILGRPDYERYRLMKEFAHQIGEILATVADILQPRSFDDLIKYGFDDPPDDPPGKA